MNIRNRKAVQLILTLMLVGTLIGTVYGAYLTYKAYVEIYGVIHSLGEVEIEIKPMAPIEGLEAREDHIGEIRVWTYSNDTELILQLAQVSQIVNNFREFTVKICLPLDVIFVVDTTDSMSAYIDAVKENLKNIVDLLSLTYKAPLRFGVVGFKDYDWETVQLFITDDYEAVKAFINGLTAESGAEDPQSHYLGLGAALNDFNSHSAITNAKVVVFISDAQAGYDNMPSFDEAKEKADKMAELGIKIDSVLCGGDQAPENWQLQYYAKVTGGQFIGPEGQKRIYAGVTSHLTWIVKLTPITPFDSFHLRLNSSPPCQKEGYYTFYVYVSFYAKAIPWHERFYFELMANLEKAQPLCLPVTPTVVDSCEPGTVYYLGKDTVTKGDWQNAVGSPIGVYGSYAHILPNVPVNRTQIPVGNFSVPVAGFTYTDYGWTPDQIRGLPFNRTDPPYWDEYVSLEPRVTYSLTGTLYYDTVIGLIQYPVFEWAWDDFNSSDPRAAHFKTHVEDADGPGTRLTCWDDGSERGFPSNGYINITLTFPRGAFMLSLYAYDQERAQGRAQRDNQTIYVTDTDGKILDFAVMNGTEFDEGMYVQFIVCGPTTIVVQVKKSPMSINALLSGIFVDKLECKWPCCRAGHLEN